MNQTRSKRADEEAAFRYGAVFLLTFGVAVFIILAPDGQVSRAFTFALVAAALMVVVATSRERGDVRRRQLLIGSAAALVLTIGIAVDLIPRNATFLLTAFVTAAIPVTLARGLLRLVRTRGVTRQAIAGALAIYLLVGLTFASAIGFVADVGAGNFFAQGTSGDPSADVYYSFTVLTTTGFGDFTAAHQLGRALAVIEMLVGQLYLVTVIGIVIGRRVETAR